MIAFSFFFLVKDKLQNITIYQIKKSVDGAEFLGNNERKTKTRTDLGENIVDIYQIK